MGKVIAFAIVLAVLLLLPNLMWLSTSTLRVQNDSGTTLSGLTYSACGKLHDLPELGPGAAVFFILEACGEDTVEVNIGDARFCQMYVEGDMYHVDASIRSPQDVQCRYGDLLSNLFVAEALF